MTRFIIGRVTLMIPTLLGVSIVVFVIIRVIPGDPLATMLGPNASPVEREAMRESLGLTDPIPVQYVTWLFGILGGDAGTSIARNEPALDLAARAFSQTLLLSGFAAVVAIAGGVLLAALVVMSRNRFVSRGASAFSSLAMSAPQYSVAVIFIVVFAVYVPLFPASGVRSATGGGALDVLHHLVLPGVAAALVPMGLIARMAAPVLRDISSSPFVDSLVARGIPPSRVRNHVFHNAVPSILAISGLQVGYLLGGVVFVEIIFSWPGVGMAVYQAISQRDLPVIQAGVLLSALAFVVVNLVVDVLQGVVDPRMVR